MTADDDDSVIDMELNEDARAAVTDQFKKQLPPDYEFDEASFIEFIMLLVANKRSKSQIRREMTPFVGDDADQLVDWLFRTLKAMKPSAPPATKGRLSSVVLAPKSDSANEAVLARPAHRRVPSATRLLTNAAMDAARSTTERRPAPGQDSQVSIAERRARFQSEPASRPVELRTRRSIDSGDPQKRSRSPRAAVMDIEAKRLKSHISKNVEQILDRKLPSPNRVRSIETKRSIVRDDLQIRDRELSTSVRFSRTHLESTERSETRPAPIRRPHVDPAKLAKLLDRRLSSPGRESSSEEANPQLRRVDSRTFTVSIRNDSIEAKLNGALEPEKVSEPKIVFNVKPGLAPKETTKPATGLNAALPAAKKPIRCTFWPNCDKGDACTFIHPTAPCKYWPSCQYGDKCLYIHDKNLSNVAIPCKFGSKCTRGAECKFAHPQADGHGEGESKICRFDKRCTKISCPFKHPERERSEYFNETIRDNDDDDEDVTVVLSNTLPATPPTRSF